MKLLRIASLAAIVLLVLAAACAGILYLNQQRLIAAVLSNVKQQTGIEILPESSHLEVRRHLVVVLEHPRVVSETRELLTLGQIRAVVSYHSILSTRGLPLYDLVLAHPVLRAPFNLSSVSAGAAARPDAETIRQVLSELGKLAGISKRVDIVELKLSDRSGTPLLQGANIVAFRTRRAPRLWHVGMDTDVSYPRLAGMHTAANFKVGLGGEMPAHVILEGQLWFWKLPLERVSVGNIAGSGKSHGQISLFVRDDATMDGEAAIGLKALTVTSPDLSAPLDLGDYSLEARFTTSPDRVALTAATIRHGGEPIATAQGHISQPYAPNPQLGFNIGGIRIDWSDILRRIGALKQLPREVEILTQHLRSGRIDVERASVEFPLDVLRTLTPAAILRQLSISATVNEVSFTPPAQTRLPQIAGVNFQLIYSKGMLSASQGSARMGNSRVSELVAQADLRDNLATVPYKLSFKADADMGELWPATVDLLEELKVQERDRLQDLAGIAHVEVRASGVLRKDAPSRPEDYLVQVEPRNLKVEFRGAPGPVVIASGTVLVKPGLVKLDRVSARATGGTADFDGDLQIGAGRMETRGITIDVHQMPVERWLAVAIDPADFSAYGTLGGAVVVTSDREGGFLVNGKMTLGTGKVALGFLRAPFLVQGATLTLHDHSLVLAMPDSTLEGSPINFKVSVQNLRDPTVRIDAIAQKLDLEVMKFVRLPWMPPSEQHFFKNPVVGHVDARKASLESFVMSNAKTDFKYDRGSWRVYNLTARSLEGRLKLEVTGRPKDDWIHMVAKINNMNVAALFLLNPKFKRSPLQGHLDLTGDLWADTNNDFFNTLAGTAGLMIRDGSLDKFTLLSRLLGFIDLKSWLTAQVPDPRVAGLPFRILSADFKGRDGVLYTDNLVLDGPVMDIVANGNVNVDQSTMNMKIGMIPFNTVNWILSNIPLVGANVAGGTKSIIAAYFNVTGPIADPRVTPAPITSVEELAKKIIGLPINLIRPDTIR